MTKIEQNESNIVDNQESAIPEKLEIKQSSPVISGTTKFFAVVLLVVGLSTAAVAYAAPELLEPIANAIPGSLFPENDGMGAAKSFNEGSC